MSQPDHTLVEQTFHKMAGTALSFLAVNSLQQTLVVSHADIDVVIAPETLDTRRLRASLRKPMLCIGLKRFAYPTRGELKAAAFRAMDEGADAIYCPLSPRHVETLCDEGIPVLARGGASWLGGGWSGRMQVPLSPAKEAFQLYKKLRNLNAAGAFAVVIDSVPERLTAALEIQLDVKLISRNSGASTAGQLQTFNDLMDLPFDFAVGEGRLQDGDDLALLRRSGKSRSTSNIHDKTTRELESLALTALKSFAAHTRAGKCTLTDQAGSISDQEFETFIFALNKAMSKKA